MNYETVKNAQKTYVFRQSVPYSQSGYLDCNCVAHGFVEKVKVRFAAGENGTLRIRPVLIIPQEIQIDLLDYAGDKFVSGDDETIESTVRFETENNAVLRVYYDNISTDALSADSVVNVDIGVTYFQITEPINIIG